MATRLELLRSAKEAIRLVQSTRDPITSGELAPLFYKPPAKLSRRLENLQVYVNLKAPTDAQRAEAGRMLERVAALAFSGLSGFDSLKSFQSATAQYDLIVSGTTEDWVMLCEVLGLPADRRTLVVEAKARRDPVADRDLGRLCDIMMTNFDTTCHLAVIFSLSGATGFPRGAEDRSRTVGAARLRQLLFHARTKKLLIVFDREDILSLDKAGSLVTLLCRKIRDLDEVSGITTAPVDVLIDLDLPLHLRAEFHEE